jgi:hypothetical protein
VRFAAKSALCGADISARKPIATARRQSWVHRA